MLNLHAVSEFFTVDQMIEIIKRAHQKSEHGLPVDVINLWTQYDFKAWLEPHVPKTKDRKFLITTARCFKFIKVGFTAVYFRRLYTLRALKSNSHTDPRPAACGRARSSVLF
jgi:hypothetical protein